MCKSYKNRSIKFSAESPKLVTSGDILLAWGLVWVYFPLIYEKFTANDIYRTFGIIRGAFKSNLGIKVVHDSGRKNV